MLTLNIKTSAAGEALANLFTPGKVVPRTWDVALWKATKRTSPALPCGAWSMASPLVLIGVPRELHIPYFAMGVPRSRDDRIEQLELGTDLARLVGRRCAAWINARATGAKIELKNRLKRGDFDLGRIGDERQRDNLARRYLEAAEALRSFGSELRLLERAWELAAEWPELV